MGTPLLSYSAGAPAFDGVVRNHVKEIRRLVAFLEASQAKGHGDIVRIVSNDHEETERALNYALEWFSSGGSSRTFCHWLSVYNDIRLTDLASALWEYLATIESLDDDEDRVRSLNLLAWRFARSGNADWIYENGLSARLTNLPHATLVVVLDIWTLAKGASKNEVEQISRLLLRCVAFSGPCKISVVVICRAGHPVGSWLPGQVIEFTSPGTHSSRPRAIDTPMSNPNRNTDKPDALGAEAMPFVRLMYGVNTAAERVALQYLLGKTDTTIDSARAAGIRDTIGGGVLPTAFIDQLNAVGGLSRGYLEENWLPTNAARFLSNRPIDRFYVESDRMKLQTLIKATDDLVDLMSGLMTAFAMKDADAYRLALDRLLNSGCLAPQTFGDAMRHRHRAILGYYSQFLLFETEPGAIDTRSIAVLDRLTAQYCDSLPGVSFDDYTLFQEQSRATYNLSFVVDNLAAKYPSLTIDPRQIRNRTVSYHFQSKPGARLEAQQGNANYQYHGAWYTYDVGDTHAAADALIGLARSTYNSMGSSTAGLLDGRGRTDIADECLFLALAMRPSVTLPADMETNIGAFLRQYPGTMSLDATRALLESQDAPSKNLLAPMSSSETDRERVTVVFSGYDLHAALVVAADLVWNRRIPVRLHLVNTRDTALRPGASSTLSVIIGAPDSPGGLGRLVADLDPDLPRIYQARIRTDFSQPTFVSANGNRCLVLMASGPGKILEGWRSARARFSDLAKSGDGNMDLFAYEMMLLPILKTVRDRIATKLVDLLVDRITRRLGGADGKAKISGEDVREVSRLGEQLKELGRRDDSGPTDLATVVAHAGLSHRVETATMHSLEVSEFGALVQQIAPAAYSDDSSVEDAESVCNALLAVTAKLLDGQLDTSTRQELRDYAVRLRGRRHEFQDLIKAARRGDKFDRNKFDAELIGLQELVRSFAQFVPKLGTAS